MYDILHFWYAMHLAEHIRIYMISEQKTKNKKQKPRNEIDRSDVMELPE